MARLHSIFELRERHTHTLFSDQLSIHVLQLSAPTPSCETGYDVRVERWARFLTARSKAKLDRLASESPIMQLAKQNLEELSQDPEAHRLARERADAIKLYERGLAASRAEAWAEGEARGEVRGQASALLKQLAWRFGPPSQEVRARVEAATIEQLDVWAQRVLTMESLEEVLA